MASSDRDPTDALIEGLASNPERYDFYQALRIVESHFGCSKPRLGTSLSASDDPIRLGQPPDLAFAPTTISALKADNHADFGRLEVLFLGLFGPQGPLPNHLTEFAGERLRHFKDPTLARFSDVFHHRMLCFFYRAWASAQPSANEAPCDRNPYADWVASLFGLGFESLAHQDALKDTSKRYHAGLLACQTRHAEGLETLVTNVLGIPCHLLEFVPHWLEIPREEQTQLGASPRTGSLGQSAILGERTRDCQSRFHLILGPLPLKAYLALLPHGEKIRILDAIIQTYEGGFLEWGVNLRLKRDEVPPLQLNGQQCLGWSSWLGPPRQQDWVDDLTLNYTNLNRTQDPSLG